MIKQLYFQQFNLAEDICLPRVEMLNSFIWSVDRNLSGATTPGQCGPENDGNKWVLWIS